MMITKHKNRPAEAGIRCTLYKKQDMNREGMEKEYEAEDGSNQDAAPGIYLVYLNRQS